MRPRESSGVRVLRWGAIAAGAVLAILVLASAAALLVLRGSLPVSSGQVKLAGLRAPVVVAFDEYAMPTLRGAHREDIARATGYLHAQNRFFQMDLLRRRAAGELSELLGPALLDADRGARVHRFRHRAARVLEEGSPDQKALLSAYAEGVNAGLDGLWGRPFEYLLLRTRPRAWTPEDSILVILAMYLDLHDENGGREAALGVMRDTLPPELFAFLTPEGTEWDAPIAGEPVQPVPIPGPEVVDVAGYADLRSEPGYADLRSEPGYADLRSANQTMRARGPRTQARILDLREQEPFAFVPGSNAWAVGGALTAHGGGGAIVANDMHLGHGVPNIWYRASFEDPRPGSDAMLKVTGITLPGAHPIITGSNGDVAWGFTNTEGDWVDLVVVETDPADPDLYATHQGPRRFERHQEIIRVSGAEDVTHEIVSTFWGPIVGVDHRGRPLALRWIAHEPAAGNTAMVSLETAGNLVELFDAAARCGVPPQNIVAAARDGRIGWSIMGAIPRRFGFEDTRQASLPQSWAAGARGWDGWLPPAEYPRLILPPAGRLWSANNRAVDGEMLRALGDGGYDLGARARQIRDDLRALRQATMQDMLSVQLDDRALFLARWRDLILEALTDETVAAHPLRHAARDSVREWGGRAAVDSAGYRIVRAVRLALAEDVLGALTEPCRQADARFDWHHLGQWEAPLWAIVARRPAHLLPGGHDSWEARILAAVDRAVAGLTADGSPLAELTWGARNTVRMRHPFSLAVPALSRWLDMPARSLPGDSNMPRVQTPGFGASQRMAVSPGREPDGYFHMPGGQSGHPLSRHYEDGQSAWEEGLPTPFLPGPAVNTLTLLPEGF